MPAREARFTHRQGALLLAVTWLAVVSIALGGAAPARGGAFLPVYISESHAGTFFSLAAGRPAGPPCTLVLIDAHDDANAVFGSDALRRARRGWRGLAARNRGLADWRRRGVIQCFDWIEPLMPDLVGRVLWVPAGRPGAWRCARLARQARARLDACEEAEPRGCGELGARWRVAGLAGLASDPWLAADGGPVVVSVDLDFFADVPAAELAETFRQTWETVLALPGLSAVTFAVSAPWQPDRARAERLTVLAVEAATAIANARVALDLLADCGPDRSRRGRDGPGNPRLEHSLQDPIDTPHVDSEAAFALTTAGPELRTMLLQRRGRLAVPAADEERWRALLDGWAAHPFQPAIRVDACQAAGHWRPRLADPDGPVRVHADEVFRVRLANPAGGTVRWFAQVPAAAAFNVFGNGFGFAEGAPRWVRRQPRLVATGSVLFSRDLAPVLDPELRSGSVFLWAEVDRDGERWRSDEVCLAVRVAGMTGFRAALSELFGRPYVFGAALLRQDGRSGPDLATGADCATFLIDGLRHVGWRVPWTDPACFSRFLEPLAVGGLSRASGHRPIRLSPADLEAGLFLHLGRHMAAVWEDRPPVGSLDPGDLAAHQLEDLPQIVPISKLVQNRKKWRLLRWPQHAETVRLVFGGDVMLGRRVGEAIDRRGLDPFVALAPFLASADRVIVNLEAVPAAVGTVSGAQGAAPGPTGPRVAPPPNRRRGPAVFVATPATPALLARAGIDLVSLANNHAGDLGPGCLVAAIDRLNAAGVATCGAGEDPFSPASFEVRGTRFAVFGFSDGPAAGPTAGPTVGPGTGLGGGFGNDLAKGVANGPVVGPASGPGKGVANGIGGGVTAGDRLAALTRAMRAVPAGTVVIVFVHWGDEHRAAVSDRQRRVADALLAAGARVIVGSGPHLVQPLADRQGVPVAWSLGNLVFDGPGPDPAWSRGALLEVTFIPDGRCVRARHLFVRIGDDGRAFPEPGGGFPE
ncbi:MAG: CapA family protein [Candidatus Riflebacteria bacterium]|nr:CapA family protein [Candidatus Riflebacteria bacterium]